MAEAISRMFFVTFSNYCMWLKNIMILYISKDLNLCGLQKEIFLNCSLNVETKSIFQDWFIQLSVGRTMQF